MNEFGLALLAQANNGGNGGDAALPMTFIIIWVAVWLILSVIGLAGLWATFQKAGEPGWAAIIPIYNLVVLVKISGKPLWWVVLYFVPCVGIVVAIIIPIEVAKNFGKGTGFGLGLAFLGFIFFPILGFGDARYQGVRSA